MAPQFRRFDGLQPYAPILEAMQDHVTAIRAGESDEAIWLLEHQAVYTGGTSANESDLLTPGTTPTHKVGRGGQWTYHGPGQRVSYVMLDLQRRNPDVRAYVHSLEGWIIDVLAGFNIDGMRREGLPGIWVESRSAVSGLDKIAAIGVRISRWVTWHGIAINNHPDISAFDAIVPCGVRDGGVTSLSQLGLDIAMDKLDTALETSFYKHFPDGTA